MYENTMYENTMYENTEKLLFSNKNYNIYSNTNIENLFKIQLINNTTNPNIVSDTDFISDLSYYFLSALKKTNLLNGSMINNANNEISFQAHSIIPIKEFIKVNHFSYEKSLEVISSLSIQIHNLQKIGYSYYGLDLESIIVINNSIFLQISLDHLVLFDLKNKNIIIQHPFSKQIFISPQLKLLQILPISICSDCIYESLTELCIYLLLKKKIYLEDSDYSLILTPIEGTKLYWFLKRSIEKKIWIYI